MADRISIVEACESRRAFNFPLYPWQRDLLDAVDHHEHTTHIAAVGRQSGKTECLAIAGAHNSLLRSDLDEMLPPGSLRHVICIATARDQARLVVQRARARVDRSPMLRGLIVGMTDDSITFELPTGRRTRFLCLPSNSRGIRGLTSSMILLDEAAHLLDSDGQAAAGRLWEALEPMQLKFGRSARAIISSTPFGESGWFYDRFTAAAAGALPGWRAWHLSTGEANPDVDQVWLAAKELEVGTDLYRQEYLAEFVASGGSWFDLSRIEFSRRGELGPEAIAPGSAICGIDPGLKDGFGIAVVGRRAEDPSKLVCCLARSLRPSGEVDTFEGKMVAQRELVADVARICRLYGAQAVTDQYAASSYVQALAAQGIPCDVQNLGATSLTQLFGQLRASLLAGEIDVADDVQLITELRRGRTKFVAGSAQVELPRTAAGHCDIAMSLAQACFASVQRGYGGGLVRGGPNTGLSGILTRPL